MFNSLHLTALWQKLLANGYHLSPGKIAEIQQLLINKQCTPKDLPKYVVPLVASNKEEQAQLTELIKQFYEEKNITDKQAELEQTIEKDNWLERNKQWMYPLVILMCLLTFLMALYFVVNKPSEIKYTIRTTNFADLKQIVQSEKAEFQLSIFDETGRTTIEHENYNILIGNDTLPVDKDFEFTHVFNQLKPYTINVWDKIENNIVHIDTINTVCKLPLQVSINIKPQILDKVTEGASIKFEANVKNYAKKDFLIYRWYLNPSNSEEESKIRYDDGPETSIIFEDLGNQKIELFVFENNSCLEAEQDSVKLEFEVVKEKISEPKVLSFKTYPTGDPKPLTYKPNYWNKWLFLPLLPLLIWLLSDLRIRYRNNKIERRNKYFAQLDTSNWDSRPIELEFDNKGELINFGNSLKESSLLMRRKSELENNRIDAGKTANKSAQNYGWFSPMFQKTKLNKHFIVLIDSEFPDSHQTALFNVLSERLQSFQIALQVYYYSYYVDTLYDADNNKYATEKILQNQPDAYLIIFGDAEALIDLNKLMLNRQSMDLFSQLTQKKAIVSPVAIKDWSAKEAILKTAFVVVPADLEAFNLMLQAIITDIPVEEEKLLRLINRQYSCIFYDFTELEELKAYLSQYKAEEAENLLQWLCALAVYPKLNWSITVKLGAALSKALNIDLHYNTLLLMSRIKWLHDGLLKDNLRLQMLKELDTKNEIIARHAIMQLLNEVSDKVGEKAVANFEYQSQRAVNGFFLDGKELDGKVLDKEAEKQSMRYWEKHLADWPLEKYIEDKTNKNLMPIINNRKAGSFKEYFELKESKYNEKVRCIRSLMGSVCLGIFTVFIFTYLSLSPQNAQPYDLFIDFNRYDNWCFGTLDTMDISFINQDGRTKTVEKLERSLKISGISADENLGILKIDNENLLIVDTIDLKAEKGQQKIIDSLYVDIDNCDCPFNNLESGNKKPVYCLVLSGDELNSIPDLSPYNNLLYLDLSANQIQKIENLHQFVYLKNLDLSGNNIQKIENLHQLKELYSIDLSSNQIQKIENLDQSKRIENLSLSGNQIQKIENLHHLSQLKLLYISFNQIEKIENLNQLQNLESIDLSNNNIQEISNLNELKKLKTLDLSYNKIQKIENLNQLQNLEELYLSNELEPYSIIEGLNLLNNPITGLNQSGISKNPELILPFIKDKPKLMTVFDSLVNVVNKERAKQQNNANCDAPQTKDLTYYLYATDSIQFKCNNLTATQYQWRVKGDYSGNWYELKTSTTNSITIELPINKPPFRHENILEWQCKIKCKESDLWSNWSISQQKPVYLFPVDSLPISP